jgi:hypothetical protein
MKILTLLVLATFYLPYYSAIIFITLLNLTKHLLNLFTQSNTPTHKISPFDIAHKDVFSPLCNSLNIQMTSFHIKVSN